MLFRLSHPNRSSALTALPTRSPYRFASTIYYALRALKAIHRMPVVDR